jgi:hypothetical protein
MNSKYLKKKNHKRIRKSWVKFVFLTKKFKEKNKCYVFETFLNAMIRNIKIHNILDIIKISKSMEPNECIKKSNNNENVHLGVSYDFSNFDGSRLIKV